MSTLTTGTRSPGPNTEVIAPYQPLPWQIAAWRDQGKVSLYTGSAGGGKSRAAAEKVHGFLLKYPGSTWLALRKAREFATKSIVPFMQRAVIGADPNVRYMKSDLTFEYSNGSRLYIGGMKDDAQREAIRSIGGDGGIDGAWLEEANAFSEQDFNEVLARLRGKAASWRQIILTTNPDTQYHWINQRLIQKAGAAVFYSGEVDNPHNPSDYREILATLTGIDFDRLVLGLWKQAEGAVYEFDNRIHLVKRFDPPKEWRRFRVIDFGFTNPFVCQWWALDGDGRMYLYREIYMSQRTVKDHAAQIKALGAGEQIETTVTDHDAEDQATLRQEGISTIRAIKDVSPGIQAVQQRLRVQPDGKPRLFVMEGALAEEDARLRDRKLPTSTLQEFGGYVYPKGVDGKPVKEAPVKVNDHGMDAVRYAVMFLDDRRNKAEMAENPFFKSPF